MPKIKLEHQQLTLIKDSLNLRYSIERMAYYKILCDALGISEGFDISNDYFVDSGIFLVKKNEAIAAHERLRDIYQARVNLFEAEHRGESSFSEEDQTYLNENNGKRAIEEGIIYSINEKFELLAELKNLSESLEKKTAKKEPHPLADYDGGGRLTSPTDTLIG